MTHCDHREQNVAGSGSLKRRDGRVDERVDRRGGEDQSCSEVAHNLHELAGASTNTEGATYGYVVGPLCIRGDCDGDACDAEEHEDQRPPGEVGEATMEGRYYGADECDDPGELHTGLVSAAATCHNTGTDDADGDGCESEGVADDAAEAERGPLAVAVAVFHFVQ